MKFYITYTEGSLKLKRCLPIENLATHFRFYIILVGHILGLFFIFWMWRWIFLIFIWFGRSLGVLHFEIHRSFIWYDIKLVFYSGKNIFYSVCFQCTFVFMYRKFLIDFTKSVYTWCIKIITFMFLRRQTLHPPILSIVWYFTDGNHRNGAFNT